MRVLTNTGKYVIIQPLAEPEIPIFTSQLLKCNRLINHHQRLYLQCEGIASKLMDCVEASAKERGFPKIGLDVSLSNHLARTIYEKRGYKNQGIPADELRGFSVVNGKEYFWCEPNCIFFIKSLLAQNREKKS